MTALSETAPTQAETDAWHRWIRARDIRDTARLALKALEDAAEVALDEWQMETILATEPSPASRLASEDSALSLPANSSPLSPARPQEGGVPTERQ